MHLNVKEPIFILPIGGVSKAGKVVVGNVVVGNVVVLFVVPEKSHPFAVLKQ